MKSLFGVCYGEDNPKRVEFKCKDDIVEELKELKESGWQGYIEISKGNLIKCIGINSIFFG